MAGSIGNSAGIPAISVGTTDVETVSVGDTILWQRNSNNSVAYTVPFLPAPAPPPPPPPPPPPALALISATSSTLTVGASGTAPDGFGTVVGYNFYRNGVKRNDAPVASGAYTFTGLTAATAYTVAFTFVNSVGTESAQFASQSMSTVAANTELPLATRNAIDALVAAKIKPTSGKKPDGCLLGVSTPDGEYFKAYGGDRTAGQPLTLAQRTRYGSVTKLFTHVLILKRISEGRLTLDSKVSEFVPDIPNGSQITVEMLITMASGLKDYLQSDAGVQQTYFLNPTAAFDPMPYIRSYAPEFPPGQPPEGWSPGGNGTYSNSNTVLLGKILESIDTTNRPYSKIVKEDLFDVAGLSTMEYPAGTSITAPFMRSFTDNLALPAIQAALGPFYWLAGLFGYPTDAELERTAVNAHGYGGSAGAIAGTIGDLVKFGKFLFNDEFLSPTLATRSREKFQTYLKYTPVNAWDGPGIMEFSLRGVFWGQWFGWVGNIGGYMTVVFVNINDGSVIALSLNNFGAEVVDLFYRIAYLLNPASTTKIMDRVVRPAAVIPAAAAGSVSASQVLVARAAGDSDGTTTVPFKVPYYV